MNIHLKLAVMVTGGVALLIPHADAQTTYAPRDLILGFRQVGGVNDLEVNIGQASLYYGAANPFTVPGVNGADITATFGNFNNVLWSVGGTVRTGDGGDPSLAVSCLFVTRPRSDASVQSDPWLRQSSGALAGTSTKIVSIANNFANQTPTLNSAFATLIPDASAQSYHTFVGSGNYGGTFRGNVENLTPASFLTGNSVSDLYEILPGSGSSTYLGSFSFDPSGALTFSPVPEPSTWALLSSAGLLAFSLRVRSRRNKAITIQK